MTSVDIEDVYTVEEFFVTNKDDQNNAGHFSIQKPKYNTITKNHKCGVEVINTTYGWYHISHVNEVYVYITKDHKKFKLVGVGYVQPGYIPNGEFLCSLINNQIIAVFANYFRHVHLHDMKQHGYAYSDIKFVYQERSSNHAEGITVKLPSFKYHDETYYPHIVLGSDLKRLTGFKTKSPETEDFVMKRGSVETIPDISYDFQNLLLKSNFSSYYLVNLHNVSTRYFDTLWFSNVLISITNPDVEKLEFWFENERGERIKNDLGKTIIHLRFVRE